MNPDSPLYDVRPGEDYLGLDVGRARFETVLLSFFRGRRATADCYRRLRLSSPTTLITNE